MVNHPYFFPVAHDEKTNGSEWAAREAQKKGTYIITISAFIIADNYRILLPTKQMYSLLGRFFTFINLCAATEIRRYYVKHRWKCHRIYLFKLVRINIVLSINYWNQMGVDSTALCSDRCVYLHFFQYIFISRNYNVLIEMLFWQA